MQAADGAPAGAGVIVLHKIGSHTNCRFYAPGFWKARCHLKERCCAAGILQDGIGNHNRAWMERSPRRTQVLMRMRETRTHGFKPPDAKDPVLFEVVRRLLRTYQPLRIYLFGSAARGDAGPDSDYDIMVVVPDDTPAELRDSKLGYQVLGGLGIAKDILVWTRHDFEEQLHLRASLPATILDEGKLLYGA